MPEVKVCFRIMTDDEFDSVAEVMADLIIGHIQTDKDHKGHDKIESPFTETLQEKIDGTV